MKIPTNIAAWLQFNLYLLTLSGYSADLFTCGKPEELRELKDDPRSLWQFAVDIIYRGIKCGLIDVWDGGNRAPGTIDYSLELVKELARFDPRSHHVCWFGSELEATELCQSLVDKYGIYNFEQGELCDPFIEEVEALFAHNQVEWSNFPLVKLG